MVKVSSDTLRYYDEIRLLNPDYINPSNNYRYYTEEQVKELLYIMDLKDCGFNLDEIKAVIRSDDETEMKQIFEKKKADLLNQRKKINSSLERIENKLKIMEEQHMKQKILIVDDASFMRLMVKDILQKNGYEVLEAADGIEGVNQYKEHKPALTLMDITMPNMNGLEAVKKIKEIDGGAKIVMLSAMAKAGFIAESFVSGAVDFIAKPFQADRLISTVNKHLNADVKLDINEVNLWHTELAQASSEQVKEELVIDEQKLAEKLYEAVESCINKQRMNIDYNSLTKSVINTIRQQFDKENQNLTQHTIDSLAERFTKA